MADGPSNRIDPSSPDQEREFTMDGVTLRARKGETVAAALLAVQHRRLRTTSRTGQARGLFCGMGVCFDCVMQIDGVPNQRTCQVVVQDGMKVETQSGNGTWR